jgi:PAS domain S-box-containing protein
MTENKCIDCVISAPAYARKYIGTAIIFLLLVLAAWQWFVAHSAYSDAERSQRHANLWKNIISHSTQAVIVLDANGAIVDWNTGSAILLGYEAKDVIGKTFPDHLFVSGQLVLPDGSIRLIDDPAELKEVAAACAVGALDGYVFTGRAKLRDKAGVQRNYDVRLQGVRNSNNWYVVQLYEVNPSGLQIK